MGAAGAEVLAGLALAQADLGEQAGKHGDVDLVGGRVGVVRGEARVARGLAQLRVQVLPFADAQEVQELGAQLLAEPAAGQRFPALGDVPPQVEVAQEIRAVGGEAGVLLVGGLALFDGPLARVLHRQRGRDHQHLAQAAGAVGLDEHAAEAGVDRQGGQGPADGAQRGAVERAQLVQEREAVVHRAGVGRVDERERGDLAEVERDHLQHDPGEVGAQDLRVGEGGAGVEVVLGVEADADAVGDAAAAARPLVRAGLADLLDRQPLDLQPPRVAGDAREAGVDHVADAGDGQRGLGDVGGEHDPAAQRGLPRREHALLLGRGLAGVEGEDLHAGRGRVARQRRRRCRGSRARRGGTRGCRPARPGGAR